MRTSISMSIGKLNFVAVSLLGLILISSIASAGIAAEESQQNIIEKPTTEEVNPASFLSRLAKFVISLKVLFGFEPEPPEVFDAEIGNETDVTENPEIYKRAISEYVAIPNDAKYTIETSYPYDVKPYINFYFLFWWNESDWHYRAVGETKPNSNQVRCVDIKAFHLNANSTSIFNQYGVIALENDFTAQELEVLQDSRIFIAAKYVISNYGNNILPDFEINSKQEAENLSTQLFKIENPQASDPILPGEYEVSLGVYYKNWEVTGDNFNLEIYPQQGFIVKRGVCVSDSTVLSVEDT